MAADPDLIQIAVGSGVGAAVAATVTFVLNRNMIEKIRELGRDLNELRENRIKTLEESLGRNEK